MALFDPATRCVDPKPNKSKPQETTAMSLGLVRVKVPTAI